MYRVRGCGRVVRTHLDPHLTPTAVSDVVASKPPYCLVSIPSCCTGVKHTLQGANFPAVKGPLGLREPWNRCPGPSRLAHMTLSDSIPGFYITCCSIEGPEMLCLLQRCRLCPCSSMRRGQRLDGAHAGGGVPLPSHLDTWALLRCAPPFSCGPQLLALADCSGNAFHRPRGSKLNFPPRTLSGRRA